ncbi:MAG: hypothetical protein IT406_02265 [Candidatus Yanofskybacteria bacterium]|nr:hypothetical protein [Candidatus Yanofskybacteria bacterium]
MIEPTDPRSPEVIEYISLSPYAAALQGKDPIDRELFGLVFDDLPEPVKDTLTDPTTVETIKQWARDGLFPATHAPAIAKLIGLVALDEVAFEAIPQLLERIGLSRDQAGRTTAAITKLLQALTDARANETAEEAAPQELRELPPLTQRVPPQGPHSGTETPARNIIDLRKKPEA